MSSRSSKHVTERQAVAAKQDQGQEQALAPKDTLLLINDCVRQHLLDLHKCFREPERARSVLKTLDDALQPLLARGISCADIARDVPLRRNLSLVVGDEMQREESYTLSDLTKVLDRHISTLAILFQYPAVSRTIAASILAPTLFPIGAGSEQPYFQKELDAVVCRLQRHSVDVTEGKSIFNCWQELARESLVGGYSDPMSALTPQGYLCASRIALHSVELDGVNLDRASSVLVESLRGAGGHPRWLFEVLHPDTRARTAQRINLENVVEWLCNEMRDVTHALSKFRSAPPPTSSDHLSEEQWNSKNKVAVQLKRLVDAVRFFNLYHECIAKSPDRPAATGIGAKSEVFKVADLTFKTKLSRVSAELMEELALSFQSKSAAVRCEREFAFALAEFFAETAIAPDESLRRLPSGRQEGIFSWGQLLPGVEQALASGDFESAANLRLIFPLEKAGYSVHDTVDEYIQKNQALVLTALENRASTLRATMIRLVNEAVREFPPELKAHLLAYCQGMERFLSPDSIGSCQGSEAFNALVSGLSPLIRGLLAWDGIVERVRNSGNSGERLPHPFQGSVVAATLVSMLRLNPKMQRAIVKRCWTLEGVSQESKKNEVLLSRAGLLAFVRVTDQEFQSARNEVGLHTGGAFDISYERERARRAQLLYDLAVDKPEQTIATAVIPTELEIGSGVVREQERRAAQQGQSTSPIGRHEQEMLRFLLEGTFAKGRPLGPIVERCRGAIEKGTTGAGPEEIRVEDSAFDMLVITALEDGCKQLDHKSVSWVREQLIGRFLALFQAKHYESRRNMARLLCAVLDSKFGDRLCTESKTRAELSVALNTLINRKVNSEEQRLRAWDTFIKSAPVVTWGLRMGILQKPST